MMNKFVGAMCALGLAVSVPATANAQAATAEQAAELTEARAIIAFIFPPSQRQQMMDKMLNDIITPMRQSLNSPAMDDPGFKALVDEFLDRSMTVQRGLAQETFPKTLDAMATAYVNEFTLAELKEVRSFAATPTGSHYLSRSTALIGDPAVQKVNVELFTKSRELSEQLLPEFKEKIAAYFKLHPEVLAKFGAAKK